MHLFLMIAFLVCELIAALAGFGANATWTRVGWMPLGLAFFAVDLLLGATG